MFDWCERDAELSLERVKLDVLLSGDCQLIGLVINRECRLGDEKGISGLS